MWKSGAFDAGVCERDFGCLFVFFSCFYPSPTSQASVDSLCVPDFTGFSRRSTTYWIMESTVNAHIAEGCVCVCVWVDG